jgi:PTH1 family peptidyl-tRNA hydrolase
MLIVGLGNPGLKYAKTKHNIGFWIVDKLVSNYSAEFKLGKGNYMYSKHNDITFLKPLTYMNDSGIAIKEYIDYFNIAINQLLVIYDDVDLTLGDFRFKSHGSSAGQKGMDSIIYHLKTDEFCRLKIGIGSATNHKPLKSYVLSPFEENDILLLEDTINHCCEAVNFFLNHSINETMNKYNQKNKGLK